MRIVSIVDFLLMQTDKQASEPMNRQIYKLIREAVLEQNLSVGFQLPSTRNLAKELTISRNTVTYAYEQLIAEGYLETHTGSGTYVADTIPERIKKIKPVKETSHQVTSDSLLSARGMAITDHAGFSEQQWEPFIPGVPDIASFPYKIWNRIQNKYWRLSKADLLTYGQGGGYYPLREAIAEYLRNARSVNCEAKQVIITAGIHQSLDITVKLLANIGDSAWVEEPCYWGTRSVLNSLDIQVEPIAVDESGMNPTSSSRPPRFICTSPSHQYPLGTVMSLARRRMLLAYAAAHQSWIIEDDYDSEFRYDSPPLASLQGMDQHQRVLYMGTFSKTLFPGLRIAYLVVPEALATAFEKGSAELYRGGQVFLQAALADFMNEGHFVSHIRKMRKLYSERRHILQQAISDFLPDNIICLGGEAGLHLTLLLPPQCHDQAISREAKSIGIIVRPLSGYYMHQDTAKPGLLLGYANIPDKQIRPLFKKLADIINQHIQRN